VPGGVAGAPGGVLAVVRHAGPLEKNVLTLPGFEKLVCVTVFYRRACFTAESEYPEFFKYNLRR